MNPTPDPRSSETTWDRWTTASLVLIPWLTLAASTAIALLRSDRYPGERLGTLALVAVAATWVYAMFSRAPEPRREHQARMLVYFVGLLVLASLLMARNPMFFIFAITGFFHAAPAPAVASDRRRRSSHVDPDQHDHHRVPVARPSIYRTGRSS